MMALLATFVSLLFFLSLVSARLGRTILTRPIVFIIAGMLTFPALPTLLEAGFNASVFLAPAGVWLVLSLLTDASHTELVIISVFVADRRHET
jgi:hypothetical protein